LGSLDEKVLVVSAEDVRALGLPRGYSLDPGGAAAERLLASPSATYKARREVEDDPAWRQLIPYVVVRSGAEAFSYARGGSGAEGRLHGRRSLGVGGHVRDPGGGASPAEALGESAARELLEELEFRGDLRVAAAGLIDDDSDPVGAVHLGVVLALELPSPEARAREDALADARFVPIAGLAADADAYESWSRLLIAALPAGPLSH